MMAFLNPFGAILHYAAIPIGLPVLNHVFILQRKYSRAHLPTIYNVPGSSFEPGCSYVLYFVEVLLCEEYCFFYDLTMCRPG
jgi:hypothetical protein